MISWKEAAWELCRTKARSCGLSVRNLTLVGFDAIIFLRIANRPQKFPVADFVGGMQMLSVRLQILLVGLYMLLGRVVHVVGRSCRLCWGG